MAGIVLGVGTSHSPLLVLGGEQWAFRSQDDRRNRSLNTLDGRLCSYDELVAQRGERFGAQSDPACFPVLARQAEAALDRLAAALLAARPDVVVVVGDDQGELFGPDNFPAISVFHGPALVMKPFDHLPPMPSWADREFWAGYGMDLPNRYPGAPALGLEVVHGLIDEGVDVASSDRIVDPTVHGFGHAFGFVIQRLMRDLPVPMLPVLLNTYFPPNTPTAARCHEIGRKLGRVLRGARSVQRVAVVASGGLSHFLCEEAHDRRVLDAMRHHDAEALGRIPQAALVSGSSEIRNWLVAHGAVAPMAMAQCDYLPVYRTPVGTGIGLGFVTWV